MSPTGMSGPALTTPPGGYWSGRSKRDLTRRSCPALWLLPVLMDQALEILRDKVERYAIPALERPLRPEEERRLPRWHLLAECILPQIDALSLQAPEELETLKAWQKQTAQRWKGGIDENVPPIMARWREKIAHLPGFAEEWDSSPILREWVFNWFTHAFYLHP